MPSTEQDKALEAFIETQTELLGLTIAPEWKPMVKTALIATLGATRFVEAFELPDEIEPAPVFEA